MTRVFVYGTLKKGQPNYYRMFDSTNGKAEFLASACTTQKYPLVIANKYNIPFLLNIPGQGRRVQGEIYKVDDQMLKFLDDFEGVPTMYQRTLVELEVKEWVGEADGEKKPAMGSKVEAFVYSTTAYEPEWPSLPNYESYDSLWRSRASIRDQRRTRLRRAAQVKEGQHLKEISLKHTPFVLF
ncbi:Gamma-glutamylaminecyclotransferase [Nibea albiflora]|uniref:Gamma-glutamylaminecyclotransferase n=1 Tax=Nibea albiflora TaxID=240163 RepID=A0ACB7ESB6_NIBAL|nr:Gamma-glutamylaminecyclotransferase [Nibea albiflora]